MDIERVTQSPVGSVVPISGTDGLTGRDYAHFAFLPAPLPGSVPLSSATWTKVAAAEAALGRLDQAAQQMPEPALLRRPALRREAQSTSALEGTYAPFETVLASETEDRGHLPVDLREVLNYVVAAEEGFGWVIDRPLTLGLLEHLQGVLVADTPSAKHDAGRIRTRQVVIGEKGTPVEQARYVPPPEGDQLRTGLEQWVRWVNDPPADISPVARAAMAHYQFEALHPFADGNGRIGRLLIAMGLVQAGVLREPVLVVSPWFEARRDAYQSGFLELTYTGDWDKWVEFFAIGVAEAADTTRHRIDALLKWRDRALVTVQDAGLSGVAERVAGQLIGMPILTAPRVARAQGVTPQGAMFALRKLVELGLVTERRQGGRVQFIALEVLEALQA